MGIKADRTTKNRACVAFSGGGSGGHILPALAVAECLSAMWDGRIVWIGSRGAMERSLLADTPYRLYRIPAGKLRRYLSVENAIDGFRVLAGIVASVRILLRERPALVFAKGGYVSVPPAVAAWLLRIPVVTHESDYDPGLATKINSLIATRIFVSFEDTVRFFSPQLRAKVTVTGNPVRPSVLRGDAAEGRRLVGCPADRKLVLVLGGSLGAASVNRLVEEIRGELARSCFVVHQRGSREPQVIAEASYRAIPFLRAELAHVLAAADLVVSRAGANTLSELAACGRPSVLLPLPVSGSRGDQLRNAEYFRRAGAALVLADPKVQAGELLAAVLSLLEAPDLLAGMGRKAMALGAPDAAARIAALLSDGLHGA